MYKVGSHWTIMALAATTIGLTNENGHAINFNKITVDGNVDTNIAGQYEVIYSYTDAGGKDTKVMVKATNTGKPGSVGDNTNRNIAPKIVRVSQTDENANQRACEVGAMMLGVSSLGVLWGD